MTESPHKIPEKANRILNLVLLTMILIALRLWHLTVVQYNDRLEESRKPQRKTVVEPARRATIRDRYGLPLAINKIQYNVAILYTQIRELPAIVWTKGPNGTKIKQFKRKEYITELSQMLAKELQLDAERLEDLIHSKAALYYHLPFVIREEISEKEYYRLKMLEKDWVGLHVQHLPKRTYLRGKTAADVIGYMGAINKQEYEAVIRELKTLEHYLQEQEAGEDPPLPTNMETPQQVRRRLKELHELAYTLNDYVGKTGVEGYFEEQLRGYRGRKSYYSDARGNFLRELPGSSEPLPGQRIELTISTELQEYAEMLLAQNERIRETQVSKPTLHSSIKQPWIKGGAVVAMDPRSGEILALASYPRMDPNDFIASANPERQEQKRFNIGRWFESEEYIGQIWDQRRPLERERYNDALEQFVEESLIMSWDNYLQFILAQDSPLHAGLMRVSHVQNSIALQHAIDTLLSLSGQNNAYWLLDVLYPDSTRNIDHSLLPPDVKQAINENLEQHLDEVERLKAAINPFLQDIPDHYNKLLLVDLCRVAVAADRFPDELTSCMDKHLLSTYRDACASVAMLDPVVRQMAQSIYHETVFKTWRVENEKAFLKEKREEEKQARRYPKPYIDYLDAKEQELFHSFWKTNRCHLLSIFLLGDSHHANLQPYYDQLVSWHRELAQGAHQSIPWRHAYMTLQRILKGIPDIHRPTYIKSLRSYHELNRPLLGHYRQLKGTYGRQLEKHLAGAFHPKYGFGFGRSHAFRQSATQGSLFKLVTSYAALSQRYQQLGVAKLNSTNLNPLTIIDSVQKQGQDLILGYQLDGTPIMQYYKGGRLPKSSVSNIGKIDLPRALEYSSNTYFSLLAGEVLKDPDDLLNAAMAFSYGSRTGIDLPGEIPGRLPDDLQHNRTGLYSTAIGQHSLVVTPLQTSVMLSTIANGGNVLKPKIIKSMAAVKQRHGDAQIVIPHQFAYQESLSLVGLHFPLFVAAWHKDQKDQVQEMPTETKRTLPLPPVMRGMLLDGMQRVVTRMQEQGLGSLSRLYRDYPEAISDFLELKDILAGKTSTSESMEVIDLDPEHGTNMYTHVWFGGIAMPPDHEAFTYRNQIEHPELVVVVYLRYGKYGKEAAPLAAQLIKKWQEIQSRNRKETGA